jgi:hypothetical protein
MTGRLTVNLFSWKPVSPAFSQLEMCGMAPSSVWPPASAKGQWLSCSSIDTWARGIGSCIITEKEEEKQKETRENILSTGD